MSGDARKVNSCQVFRALPRPGKVHLMNMGSVRGLTRGNIIRFIFWKDQPSSRAENHA